jgi:hypothetical protein
MTRLNHLANQMLDGLIAQPESRPEHITRFSCLPGGPIAIACNSGVYLKFEAGMRHQSVALHW